MATLRTLISVLVSTALLAATAQAEEPPGADSPQALVERMAGAAADDDFAELANCLAPEARTEMAASLLAATMMMVAFAGFGGEMAVDMAEGMADAMSDEGAPSDAAEAEAARAAMAAEAQALNDRYVAVLRKHGLEEVLSEGGAGPEDTMESVMARVDQPALIADLFAFMESLGESTETSDGPVPLPSDITDYRIDGDHATAQSPDGPVEFVRVDGRWYFLPDMEPPGGGMQIDPGMEDGGGA